MKWQNDPYREMKQHLYDVLCSDLLYDMAVKGYADRITIRQIFDAIDELVDKLLPEDE